MLDLPRARDRMVDVVVAGTAVAQAFCTLVLPRETFAFSTWLEAGKYCICGARNAARNRENVMEIVANSSSDRRQVGRQKDPQRSSVTNGSKLRIEGCSAWVRRCKDIIEAQILDPGGEDNC